MNGDAALQAAIEAHHLFDFGRTGVRRVAVDIHNQNQVAVTYLVDHLWERQSDECRSLMHLVAPRGMNGTSLLMLERTGSPECHVWLKLSTAKRTVSIPFESISQYALGTDFTYSDLLFWYRFNGDGYCLMTPPSSDESDGTVVESRSLVGTAASRVRLALRSDGALLAYERSSADGSQVLASYRARDWKSIAGVSFPTSIVKTRMNAQYLSEIRLLSVSFGRDVPSGLLCETTLGRLGLPDYADLLEDPDYAAGARDGLLDGA